MVRSTVARSYRTRSFTHQHCRSVLQDAQPHTEEQREVKSGSMAGVQRGFRDKMVSGTESLERGGEHGCGWVGAHHGGTLSHCAQHKVVDRLRKDRKVFFKDPPPGGTV